MNTVITIGRQYGSGGHAIGAKLAEKLGINYFDKDLIKIAAKESGLCPEILEHNEERPTSSFLYNLVMDAYSFGIPNSNYVDMPLGHKVFLAQFETIKKLASQGPCVIVGRCADYALADYNNVINLFIYGSLEDRTKRVSEAHPDLKEKDIKDLILKNDKQRASYYNYYSNKKWGKAETYDLCINSFTLGIDDTVDLLVEYINHYDSKIK